MIRVKLIPEALAPLPDRTYPARRVIAIWAGAMLALSVVDSWRWIVSGCAVAIVWGFWTALDPHSWVEDETKEPNHADFP